MCRLFGFRSVIQSQVHSSLVQAENALGVQSSMHPDGWGISYYINNIPHVIKSDKSAISDSIFKTLSGIVSSQTVLAHIRKATLGQINVLNTHPFQYGQWSFAHNGNIKDFEQRKPRILEEIHPEFQKFIIGSTDSEVVFFYLLSKMSLEIDINSNKNSIKEVSRIIKKATSDLLEIIGPICTDESCGPKENYLTFILTNGTIMLAHCAGKQLYYSTYKKRCNDRDVCASFSAECEAPSLSGNINHLIFTSEPLSGENIWIKMKEFEIIGVDESMKIHIL